MGYTKRIFLGEKKDEDGAAAPEAEAELPEEIDIDSVFNIDDIDGKGQPLYSNFKAEGKFRRGVGYKGGRLMRFFEEG